METLATILFFVLGGLILFLTVAVLFKIKVSGILFDIAKYGIVVLVSGISATYGNYIFAAAVLLIGVLSFKFLGGKK